MLTLGLLFWLLYIIGFIFGGFVRRGPDPFATWFERSLFWWILIGLLGFKVFGGPIAH